MFARRPSEITAQQTREVRQRKRWTQQQLSDRIGELGGVMDRVVIAKIETGRRGIPLDDALLLAVALNIAPSNLLLPMFSDEPVALAPQRAVSPRIARSWFRAQRPLPGDDERAYWSEVSDEDWHAMQMQQGKPRESS